MLAPIDWTPLLALLACVAVALSTAWWPRAWRLARRWWLVRRAALDLCRFQDQQELELAEARSRAVYRVREAIERSRARQRQQAAADAELADPWFEDCPPTKRSGTNG